MTPKRSLIRVYCPDLVIAPQISVPSRMSRVPAPYAPTWTGRRYTRSGMKLTLLWGSAKTKTCQEWRLLAVGRSQHQCDVAWRVRQGLGRGQGRADASAGGAPTTLDGPLRWLGHGAWQRGAAVSDSDGSVSGCHMDTASGGGTVSSGGSGGGDWDRRRRPVVPTGTGGDGGCGSAPSPPQQDRHSQWCARSAATGTQKRDVMCDGTAMPADEGRGGGGGRRAECVRRAGGWRQCHGNGYSGE